MTVIETRELRKVFPGRSRRDKGFVAVDGVSFQVQQGEIVGFIGPNGAGKSTTIKMLSGILMPTAGEVQVFGMTPGKDRNALAYRIGAVFGQKSQLSIHLPARQTFSLLGAIYRMDRQRLLARIEELVETFDLSSFFDVPVRKLSLGQRIRCEIASSLLHQPDLLFLDEPTIGLDTVSRLRLRETIRGLAALQKTTILLTSHDLADIERLCSRVIIIHRGRLVYADATERLRDQYLRRKSIYLRTDGEVDLRIPGIEVISRDATSARIEIDIDRVDVQQVLTALVSRNQLADITIAEAPLEEVISSIYQRAEACRAGERSSPA